MREVEGGKLKTSSVWLELLAKTPPFRKILSTELIQISLISFTSLPNCPTPIEQKKKLKVTKRILSFDKRKLFNFLFDDINF